MLMEKRSEQCNPVLSGLSKKSSSIWNSNPIPCTDQCTRWCGHRGRCTDRCTCALPPQTPPGLWTAPLAGWRFFHLTVPERVSNSFKLPGNKLLPNGISSWDKGINRHIMFPLSTQNICWKSEGFAAHAHCGHGFCFARSVLSCMRTRSLTQQLLEDRFTWKSENCLQGSLPPVFIPDLKTLLFALLRTCLHPTAPAKDLWGMNTREINKLVFCYQLEWG